PESLPAVGGVPPFPAACRAPLSAPPPRQDAAAVTPQNKTKKKKMAPATALKPSVPKQLPQSTSDFYEIGTTLSADEQAILKNVRDFMETKVAPIINDYWVRDAFPFELIPALKELNIGDLNVGDRSSRLKGMVAMEMSRVDP